MSATVNVQDVPCITVGTATIPYGQKAFSTEQAFVNGTSTISNIDSCSTAAQSVSVRGTNATATGAIWTLSPLFSCSQGSLNEYRHSVRNLGNSADVNLSLNDQALGTLAASQQDVSVGTILLMPCEGSSGAGKIMSMQVLLTATVP